MSPPCAEARWDFAVAAAGDGAPRSGRRVTGVHSSGRVLGGSATAPGWKRPAVPARVRPSPAAVRTRPQRRDHVDAPAAHAIGLTGLLRHLLPEHPVSLPGKRGAREEVGAVTKPKGRHAKVRKDRGTARKVSELVNSIARLIRAVSVLVDALRGWFF